MESGDIPIILTWKNSTSDKYNDMIRKYVHKSLDLNNYVVGDYAMFSNYYISPIDGTTFYTSDMIKILNIMTEEKILHDWETAIIKEPKTIIEKALNIVLRKISKQKNKFKIDVLTVERIHSDVMSIINTNTKTHIIQTIHRNDLENYHIMLEYVQEHIEFFFKKYKSEQLTSNLWDIFHKKLIDPYSELNFGYSITTHKAQGSTFKTVMIDVEDIGDNPNLNELQKALYTAVGRASDELGFILG